MCRLVFKQAPVDSYWWAEHQRSSRLPLWAYTFSGAMNLSNLRKNHDDRTSNKPKNEIKTNKVDHAEDIGAFSGGYSSAGRAAVINQRPSDTLRCLNSALLLIQALASHTSACISLTRRRLMLITTSSPSHVVTIKQGLEPLNNQRWMNHGDAP